MKLVIVIFMLVTLIVVGCTSKMENLNEDILQNSDYKNMTVDELNEQLKSKDFTLVDVHIPEQKHINGTDAFIPYDDIENQLDKLPQDKDAKIVIYCRTGRMSEIAAQKLAEKGYSNVYTVVGGTVEWIEKRYDM